jgi:hypothetical protein
MVGITRQRSKDDELLIYNIRKTSKSEDFYILDCRPMTNALGNTILGKGYEIISYYDNCTLEFLDIDNIHVMNDSLCKLIKVIENSNDEIFLSSLQDTNWLKYISTIMAGSYKVSKILESGTSVLVRCSDGWDRTSQICSLSQIILDPYFRTIEGFEVLVEKVNII